MMPNCMSHSGRQSTFAPESRMTTGPLRPGITTEIAGRAMPLMRRSRTSPTARKAPLLPAETTASASRSSRTRSIATARLESSVRKAIEGWSSMAMARLACTTRMRLSPSSGRMRASSPTRDDLGSAARVRRAWHPRRFRPERDLRPSHRSRFWHGGPHRALRGGGSERAWVSSNGGMYACEVLRLAGKLPRVV